MKQTTGPLSLTGRTILITGGSSGIGLELARRLNASNTVLVCGRSPERLKKAEEEVPGIGTFACDLSLAPERERLAEWIRVNHGDCSILINNAAIVHRTKFSADPQIMDRIEREFQTNCLAPIHLTKLFLPVLQQQAQAAIVYLTTGLVYAPKAAYPAYSATKAAVHSFVQGLRWQMQRDGTPVRMVEVLMPAVDTPWHEGNPPRIAIPVSTAVEGMLRGMGRGQDEIRVAGVKGFYALSRLAPGLALKLINRT